MSNESKKELKELSGVVKKRSGDKTVAVEVQRVETHPLYKKRRTTRKIYLAHDEDNKAEVGSTVMIQKTRPLSKRKSWRVIVKET